MKLAPIRPVSPAALAPLALAVLLAACSTAQQKSDSMVQAAATPLSDLNIVRADIPAALREAHKAPYGAPPDGSCAGLRAEVEALDAALGADLDTPPTAANPSLVDRGTDAAGNAAVSAVRSTAENVVPFRGWIRKLTGAERYSKEVAASIAAGTIRRAYLKGLGAAARCEPPAAPRQPG